MNGLSDLVDIEGLVDELRRHLEATHLLGVLTDELSGGVFGFPDLKEGVLRVNTFAFALLAQVVVIALRALVANTSDRVLLTTVTRVA